MGRTLLVVGRWSLVVGRLALSFQPLTSDMQLPSSFLLGRALCLGPTTNDQSTIDQECPTHTHGLRIFRGLPVRAELLRYRLQRGIKLHKRMFDCRMVFMTLPARGFGIRLR